MDTEIKKEFYIIATPIGNLEDITYRAVRIFGELDVLFCEDTRTTKHLLDHYGITVPKLMSYNAHASEKTHQSICEYISAGKKCGLVSDAGTPCISDPGVRLVSRIREMVDDVQIIPIPGASALTTALSAAGIKGNEFVFYGFLPHKNGRQTLVQNMWTEEIASVCYESTHRIMKLVESFCEHQEKEESVEETSAKTITLCHELTKIHEYIFSGTPKEVKVFLEEDPRRQKGEFVVVVHK